jgi:hypothetical protein
VNINGKSVLRGRLKEGGGEIAVGGGKAIDRTSNKVSMLRSASARQEFDDRKSVRHETKMLRECVSGKLNLVSHGSVLDR